MNMIFKYDAPHQFSQFIAFRHRSTVIAYFEFNSLCLTSFSNACFSSVGRSIKIYHDITVNVTLKETSVETFALIRLLVVFIFQSTLESLHVQKLF